MKKYILFLSIILLGIIGADSRQADAYSVTVQKDGVYAEVVPDSFVKDTAEIFKKYVKKAMKYYNKYKDADEYTYIKNVPDEYRDFIPVARKIQDSDKITIRNPFYIYYPGDTIERCDQYCFFAEKNGEKLCMFTIDIDWETEEISFWYDKMMDSQFAYDRETIGKTLYYVMDEITYAEIPDKISVVRDTKSHEGIKMLGGDGTDWEAEQKAIDKKFEKKSYNEKKDEILSYLAKLKTGKNQNKSEKNLKLQLKDEYTEPKQDEKKEDGKGIVVYIVIGVVVIMGIAAGVILWKRRKKE